jgi:hypothetical protein
MKRKPNKPQSPNLPISQSPLRYAIIGDPDDPTTWLLPHHTPKMEVDWDIIPFQVAALTGTLGAPFAAPPEAIVKAARHLAEHYQEAKRPIPDALLVLI